MSCKDCDDIVEGVIDIGGPCFVRVGNGNVMVLGCPTHLRELIEKLRVK